MTNKKFVAAFLALVLYTLILLATYVIQIKFFKVNVVFYSSLYAAAIATALVAACLWGFKVFSSLNPFERLQLAAICALIGYSFAISVPTVIDRSLSFYILEKLQQRGGGIRLDSFERVFTEEYVHEHRLVDVRLTEQAESGTLQIRNGCVILTPRGKRLATFSRFFRKNLLPKQRLLRGRYTDQLTDPFRNSGRTPDYVCK